MKQNTDLSFYWLYKGVPTRMERCYILNGRKLPLKPLYWIVIEYKLVVHWPFLPSKPQCFQVKKEWPSSIHKNSTLWVNGDPLPSTVPFTKTLLVTQLMMLYKDVYALAQVIGNPN
jgi:hypothetical protein